MREKRGCSVAMNKVVLTGKIAAMPSKEAFDAADDQGVRFDLVIVSQWQNSEEVHHEWFACVIHGKQAETFLRYTQKGATIKINGHLQGCPYETAEGQRFCAAEVVVDTFQILELAEEPAAPFPKKRPSTLDETTQTKSIRNEKDPLKTQMLEFLKDNRLF
ncbi:single-stranded DNA-binding protein [Enterococcus casseliflavus]